ncbi:unnamed protein product [Closterium sp. Naga37s-1]|nr:unnamed protein product [Closterium sp. Naga37s-1]
MATLTHENLVQLLGFCVDMQVESGWQEQVLVYEYVGNGDLKHHIHHAKCTLLTVWVESGRHEQVLVYEYVGNGDLKHHIHHAKCPLTFHQPLRIALGAAESLAYLHSFSTPIVHRDVKLANILVTHSLAAKQLI